MTALAGLFLAAFLAATLLPAQSEAVLVAMVVEEVADPLVLLAVASAGNVLGALVNVALGRGAARFRGRRWFPVSEAALGRATGWYHRFGRWSLLFTFLPVVGDPLAVVAGFLREPLLPVIVLIAIGKVARYAVLVGATVGWLG